MLRNVELAVACPTQRLAGRVYDALCINAHGPAAFDGLNFPAELPADALRAMGLATPVSAPEAKRAYLALLQRRHEERLHAGSLTSSLGAKAAAALAAEAAVAAAGGQLEAFDPAASLETEARQLAEGAALARLRMAGGGPAALGLEVKKLGHVVATVALPRGGVPALVAACAAAASAVASTVHAAAAEATKSPVTAAASTAAAVAEAAAAVASSAGDSYAIPPLPGAAAVAAALAEGLVGASSQPAGEFASLRGAASAREVEGYRRLGPNFAALGNLPDEAAAYFALARQAGWLRAALDPLPPPPPAVRRPARSDDASVTPSSKRARPSPEGESSGEAEAGAAGGRSLRPIRAAVPEPVDVHYRGVSFRVRASARVGCADGEKRRRRGGVLPRPPSLLTPTSILAFFCPRSQEVTGKWHACLSLGGAYKVPAGAYASAAEAARAYDRALLRMKGERVPRALLNFPADFDVHWAEVAAEHRASAAARAEEARERTAAERAAAKTAAAAARSASISAAPSAGTAKVAKSAAGSSSTILGADGGVDVDDESAQGKRRAEATAELLAEAARVAAAAASLAGGSSAGGALQASAPAAAPSSRRRSSAGGSAAAVPAREIVPAPTPVQPTQKQVSHAAAAAAAAAGAAAAYLGVEYLGAAFEAASAPCWLAKVSSGGKRYKIGAFRSVTAAARAHDKRLLQLRSSGTVASTELNFPAERAAVLAVIANDRASNIIDFSAARRVQSSDGKWETGDRAPAPGEVPPPGAKSLKSGKVAKPPPPPGWKQGFSDTRRKSFWRSLVTGEVVWTRPTAPAAPLTSAPATSAPVKTKSVKAAAKSMPAPSFAGAVQWDAPTTAMPVNAAEMAAPMEMSSEPADLAAAATAAAAATSTNPRADFDDMYVSVPGSTGVYAAAARGLSAASRTIPADSRAIAALALSCAGGNAGVGAMPAAARAAATAHAEAAVAAAASAGVGSLPIVTKGSISLGARVHAELTAVTLALGDALGHVDAAWRHTEAAQAVVASEHGYVAPSSTSRAGAGDALAAAAPSRYQRFAAVFNSVREAHAALCAATARNAVATSVASNVLPALSRLEIAAMARDGNPSYQQMFGGDDNATEDAGVDAAQPAEDPAMAHTVDPVGAADVDHAPAGLKGTDDAVGASVDVPTVVAAVAAAAASSNDVKDTEDRCFAGGHVEVATRELNGGARTGAEDVVGGSATVLVDNNADRAANVFVGDSTLHAVVANTADTAAEFTAVATDTANTNEVEAATSNALTVK